MNTHPAFSVVKHVFLVIFLVCLIAAPAMAQENAEQPPEWALQFQIGDDFRLTSFQGTTISISKHLSPGRHFRVGLSFSGSTYDSETINDYPVTEVTNEDDKRLDLAGFELTNQYIVDFKKMNRVTAYAGCGPKIEYFYSDETKEKNYPNSNDFTKLEDNYKRWRIGLSGVLGAEWFVKDDISILAEYQSELLMSKVSDETTYGGDIVMEKSKTKSTSYHFSSGGVKFGVSIHF